MREQREKTTYWTEADRETLRKEWTRMTPTAQIAQLLNRTPTAVSVQASRMRLPPRDKGQQSAAAPVKLRTCLGCRERFPPPWPTSYICPKCKTDPAWDANLADASIRVRGKRPETL